MTVGQLKAALAAVPDDFEVVVEEYVSGERGGLTRKRAWAHVSDRYLIVEAG